MNGKWFSFTNLSGHQTVVNIDHIRWIGHISDGQFGFIIPGMEPDELTREDYARLLKFVGVDQIAPTQHDSPTQ